MINQFKDLEAIIIYDNDKIYSTNNIHLTQKIIMKTKALMRFCIVPLTVSIFASCAHVREYQKSRINDSEMSLSNRKVEKNELNAQSYREGSSGANAGKTGGGCGCN